MIKKELINTKTSTLETNINLWGDFNTKFLLYLNPELLNIYTQEYGSIPMAAYHGLHRSISVLLNGNMDEFLINEWIKKHSKEILNIASLYKGSEWNGTNHIGKWVPNITEQAIMTFEVVMAVGVTYYPELFYIDAEEV